MQLIYGNHSEKRKDKLTEQVDIQRLTPDKEKMGQISRHLGIKIEKSARKNYEIIDGEKD